MKTQWWIVGEWLCTDSMRIRTSAIAALFIESNPIFGPGESKQKRLCIIIMGQNDAWIIGEYENENKARRALARLMQKLSKEREDNGKV